MRRRPNSLFNHVEAQAILTVLLLIVVLGLIGVIAVGIKTGKIVINTGNQPTTAVFSPDLEKKQAELLKKEKELAELEERIRIQQEELNRQKQAFMKEMQSLLEKVKKAKSSQAGAQGEALKQSQSQEESLQYLAKLYGGMKPEEVSRIFKEMDSYTVAQIISRMGRRQAAKVMAALPADKAIEITRLLKEGKVK